MSIDGFTRVGDGNALAMPVADKKAHPNAVLASRLVAAIGAMFYVPAAVALSWWLSNRFDAPWWWALAAFFIATMLWNVSAGPYLKYKHYRWAVTDDYIVITSGWVLKETEITPFNRLQGVTFDQGPIQTRFRLAEVRCKTLGEGTTLYALDQDIARELVDRLSDLASGGDATS